MRRVHCLILCALALAACEKRPPPIESVESLVANPERLKALREACKADHAKVGDAQCNAVAEASRRRFMAGGQSPYASDPVKPPAPPAAESAPSAAKD
ncbi:MAG: EexN family lipoprotein [Ottowia sp.]|uniref:EexN family lipoprotein n=1 Tax=Ottowia sp. TaxID=1898956 RepID=UPI0039E698A5